MLKVVSQNWSIFCFAQICFKVKLSQRVKKQWEGTGRIFDDCQGTSLLFFELGSLNYSVLLQLCKEEVSIFAVAIESRPIDFDSRANTSFI